MLPYFELKTLGFGCFRLPVFGLLLGTAIVVARWRILHFERAEGRTTERKCCDSLSGDGRSWPAGCTRA